MAKESRKLSAASVIFDSEGRVVLGLKIKYGKWEFPGGKIEPNESILRGAGRELYEETGLDPEKYEFIDFLDHPKWICFAYTGVTDIKPRRMEPDKHEEWRHFNFADLQSLIKLDRVTEVTKIVLNKWVIAGLHRCADRGWLDLP